MGEHPDETSDRGPFPWAVCLPLAPFAYVLSIGPAVWFYETVDPPHAVGEALRLFYLPVLKLGEMAVPVSDLLQWYIEFWMP